MACLVKLFFFSSVLTLLEARTVSPGNAGTHRSQHRLRKFPDGFKFGAATSAYQIEGAWNVSDKGESIWDHLTHTEPWRFRDGKNADITADSYHNYKRDVEMVNELGAQFYRFSIAWTRILPNGLPNYISKDGVAYYNNLINELLAHNIEPVVTIYHWDLPQKLQNLGGWANPMIEKWFGDYARIVFKLFGDRVKTWITVNEAYQICRNGYGRSDEPCAPALEMDAIADYMCAYNVQKAHAKAYHIYDEQFRKEQKGRVGYSLEIGVYLPATNSPDDIQAAEDARLFHYDMYAHAIFSKEGNFPPRLVQMIEEKSLEQGFMESRLPQYTPEEVEYIRGTADFFGVNFYDVYYAYRNESLIGRYKEPSMESDRNVGIFKYTNKKTSNYVSFLPWGIRRAINEISSRYNRPEIMVTENGVVDAKLEDNDRVRYMQLYLNEVLNSILDDRNNVTAYTAWSLMDNFEWVQGFTIKFGLYHVDFTDPQRKRTPRRSALAYKDIIKARTIDPTSRRDLWDHSLKKLLSELPKPEKNE